MGFLLGDDKVLELGGGGLHIVNVPKATGLYTLTQFILTSIKLCDCLLSVLSPISLMNILRANTPVTTLRDAALLTAPFSVLPSVSPQSDNLSMA